MSRPELKLGRGQIGRLQDIGRHGDYLLSQSKAEDIQSLVYSAVCLILPVEND
jgi:hypothetical protein